MNQIITSDHISLIKDLKNLIEQAKNRVTRIANSEMTMLYWHIGKRVSEEILKEERAEYGGQVVKLLAQHLSAEYGKGFTYTALTRMIQFYDSFSDQEIVATVSQQLSWSHIIELLPLKESKQKEFYAYMSIQNGWSVRVLRTNIHKMTYERTMLSRSNRVIYHYLHLNHRIHYLLN